MKKALVAFENMNKFTLNVWSALTRRVYAEYIALKEAIKEMLYLKEVLFKLDLLNVEASILYTDSKSAIELANNSEHHVRTKHIDIQYHFIREKVQNKEIDLRFISTKEQKADILTKELNSVTFKNLESGLGLVEQRN